MTRLQSILLGWIRLLNVGGLNGTVPVYGVGKYLDWWGHLQPQKNLHSNKAATINDECAYGGEFFHLRLAAEIKESKMQSTNVICSLPFEWQETCGENKIKWTRNTFKKFDRRKPQLLSRHEKFQQFQRPATNQSEPVDWKSKMDDVLHQLKTTLSSSSRDWKQTALSKNQKNETRTLLRKWPSFFIFNFITMPTRTITSNISGPTCQSITTWAFDCFSFRQPEVSHGPFISYWIDSRETDSFIQNRRPLNPAGYRLHVKLVCLWRSLTFACVRWHGNHHHFRTIHFIENQRRSSRSLSIPQVAVNERNKE